jgi:hypothetical protein
VAGVKKTGPVKDTETLTGGAAAKYLNEEAIRQLKKRGLTDKQILDYGSLLQGDGDTSQLQFSLANIFADKTLDGLQKIPVINAAFSLADLNVQQTGHICDCKAAEAGTQLMAFGQEEFLQFASQAAPHLQGVGSDPADAGTRWVATQAALAATTWEQQQQALRGQVLERRGSKIVEQFANTFGIDTGEGGNAFSDGLGIQGLDPAVRTSVFKKTLNPHDDPFDVGDDGVNLFTDESGPLQQTVKDLKGRQVGNLSTSSEDDQ